MNLTKTILESRTIWSNIVGLGALAASIFGHDIGITDQTELVDAALKVVAGASFVFSTIFRVKASKIIA